MRSVRGVGHGDAQAPNQANDEGVVFHAFPFKGLTNQVHGFGFRVTNRR